jgi:Zn-dependent M32 family carboxypeptidase
MTMKIVKSKEEFIAVAAEAIFDDMREQLHDLDNQATAAGVDDADILLMMSAKIANATAAYAAYLAAGIYLAIGSTDKTVAKAIAALEDDIQGAMQAGVQLAMRNVEKAKKATADAERDTEELLKKAVKSWKN